MKRAATATRESDNPRTSERDAAYKGRAGCSAESSQECERSDSGGEKFGNRRHDKRGAERESVEREAERREHGGLVVAEERAPAPLYGFHSGRRPLRNCSRLHSSHG